MPDTCCAYQMVAPVLCLSLLLNAGVSAQSRPSQPPVPLPASPGAPPNAADNMMVNRTSSADLNALPGNVINDATIAANRDFSVLKTGLIYPRLDFEIIPSAAKLAALTFAAPDEESEGAPRNFQATAYNLRGRTASGVKTGPGIIAADPRVLPLGTVVQVKAGHYSGTYTVRDTGRRVKGKIVDIWIPSHREARIFGRRAVKLQVLHYGPRRQPN